MSEQETKRELGKSLSLKQMKDGDVFLGYFKKYITAPESINPEAKHPIFVEKVTGEEFIFWNSGGIKNGLAEKVVEGRTEGQLVMIERTGEKENTFRKGATYPIGEVSVSSDDTREV